MVSNTVLAVLLGAAIVLSIGGLATNLGLLGKPQAFLPLTGQATGTAQVSIQSLTTISLPTSTIDFSSVQNNQVENTTDLSPFPFVLRNEGTVDINVTINASQLWFGTGATGTSTYYRFNTTQNETGSTPWNNATFLSPITNMSIGGTKLWLVNCTKYTNANDEIRAHIFITVPDDEPSGSKSSTVTFTASQALAGINDCTV